MDGSSQGFAVEDVPALSRQPSQVSVRHPVDGLRHVELERVGLGMGGAGLVLEVSHKIYLFKVKKLISEVGKASEKYIIYSRKAS